MSIREKNSLRESSTFFFSVFNMFCMLSNLVINLMLNCLKILKCLINCLFFFFSESDLSVCFNGLEPGKSCCSKKIEKSYKDRSEATLKRLLQERSSHLIDMIVKVKNTFDCKYKIFFLKL